MKLNWAERWVVNNPLRVVEQGIQIRWFRKAMPLRPGATVLEVGGGRGAGAKLITQAFAPAQMHCQDIDYRMIKKAHQYLSPAERKNICFHVGDVSCLPFDNNTMDAVFGFGVLHHVPNWRTAVAEISRVIKPGGVYYLEELYPALYQNILTKHVLLHPKEDRFESHDLKTALEKSCLPVYRTLENTKLGILAVAIKKDSV